MIIYPSPEMELIKFYLLIWKLLKLYASLPSHDWFSFYSLFPILIPSPLFLSLTSNSCFQPFIHISNFQSLILVFSPLPPIHVCSLGWALPLPISFSSCLFQALFVKHNVGRSTTFTMQTNKLCTLSVTLIHSR